MFEINLWTLVQLEEAIIKVLGTPVDAAMRSGGINLPTRHNMAIRTAFLNERFHSKETLAILRDTALLLDKRGEYVFAE